jgi:hypothetical protein
VTLTCLYLASSSGHIDTPDGVMMFKVTEALAERGEVSVMPIEGWPGFGGRWVIDETGQRRFYCWFGIGASLAAVPTYLLGGALVPLASDQDRSVLDVAHGLPPLLMNGGQGPPGPWTQTDLRAKWYRTERWAFPSAFRAFTSSWASAWAMALAITFVFLSCVELGFSLRVALAVAGVAAIASPAWAYAKTFFSEPVSALGLCGFFYFAVRTRSGPPRLLSAACAGALLGVSVLAKLTHAVLLPGGILFLYAVARTRPARERVKLVSSALLGLAPLLALMLAYNAARFGWLGTGYEEAVDATWSTPALEGLTGLLFSPGRGLLVYFPAFVLCLYAAVRHRRRLPWELAFIGTSFLLLLAVHAKWSQWEGGWCWGPRFLVPVLPLLPVALAPMFSDPLPRWVRAGALALVAVSVLVSFSGTIVDFIHFDRWISFSYSMDPDGFGGGAASDKDLMRWSWALAPVVRYWDFGLADYHLLPYALRQGRLFLGLFVAFLAGTTVGLAALARAWVRAAPPRDERAVPASPS